MQTRRQEIRCIQQEKQLAHCGLSLVSRLCGGRGRKRRDSGGIELAKQAESYHYGVFHQDFNIIRMKSSYEEKFASEVELRIWSEKTVQEKKMDSFMAS